MGAIYSDLDSDFPSQVLDMPRVQDVSSDMLWAVQQYNYYYDAGDLEKANKLVDNNPELKNMIINAKIFNDLRDAIIATQRVFKDDVEGYIFNVVKNKGTWSDVNKYVKYNVVYYEDNGIALPFMAIADDIPIGTIPTNTDYWYPLAIKGEQGESGTGLTPRGVWNYTTLYFVDDFVAYNNSFWQCLNQNNNSEPTVTNTNWLRIADLTEDISHGIIELRTELEASLENIYTKTETNGLIDDAVVEANGYTRTQIDSHDVQVNTSDGAHGFRYYQNELQYKNDSNWTTIETGIGGSYVGTTAPSNTEILWIDTANGGILKYYNGSAWIATKSVWG